MARRIQLEIHPDKIIGKQRPRVDGRAGFARIYTPRETLKAEELIRNAFFHEFGREFAKYEGEVVLRVDTFRGLSKSNPKKWAGRVDIGKPDADNILKLIMDALNGAAYKDDAQITCAQIRKNERIPHECGHIILINLTYLED